MDDEAHGWDLESLRKLDRRAKPGDRCPHEPAAPDLGPDSGVREPRRPVPTSDQDSLAQPVSEDA
jgi:hypothetical protein